MTPERHRRISDLFQLVAELPLAQRAAELDRLCAGDDELRCDVESLLGHHHDDRDEFHESNVGVGRQLIAAPSSPASELPLQIGRFRVVRRIGEGGMGVVFEAQQDNPRRTVALKVIRAGLASDSVVRRFRHEAEVLGRLQHPGIADIYDAGVAETPLGQQPYFAMQLIQGQPLIEWASKHGLDPRARLELFARVCDAVQYAHQRGIIHRDLKPANVLVDASGQPKVLDFGVARVTDEALTIAPMQTVTGQVIGTLPYMSPEQVSGRAGDVDTRSDVYSLGVSLYELLVGRLPYKVSDCTLPEAARIITDVEPTHLSTIDRRLRGDVETIVFKALQKDSAQRYQSVAELAADLRRYLADEPVLARPPSAMYQLRKFARRHTGLVVGTLAVFITLVIGLAGIAWFAAGESRQRATAEAASSEARRLAYRVSVGAAADAIEDGSMVSARRLLDDSPPELRGWEWRHLSTRLDDSFVQIRGKPPFGGWIHVRADGDVVQRTVRSVTCASIRSGKILREIDSIEGYPIAVNRDATVVAAVTAATSVRLYFLDEKRDAALPDLPNPVHSLAFSHDSQLLAVCDEHAAVHLFDTRALALLRSVQLPRPMFDMQFSPDGAWLAGTDFAEVLIISVERGQLTQQVTSPGFRRFTPDVWTLDSQYLLRREVRHDENRYFIAPICAANGERLAPWPEHRREVVSLDLAHDGQTALVTFADGLMRVSEVPGGATLLELHSEGGAAHSPVFSPDGTRIAFGELGGVIRLVDRATAQAVATLRGQEAATCMLDFSADGRTLFSTDEEGIIRAWDLSDAGDTDVLRGHTSYVYPVAFSPDGATLASGSWDKTVRLWDVGARRERAVLTAHAYPVTKLAFSPDGRHLISTTLLSEEVFLWELASGTHLRLPAQPATPPEFPAFMQDGKRIWLPGEPEDSERVWNIETGSIETVPLGALRELADPRVSPDGRWIARRLGAEPTLTLLSLDNPTERRVLAPRIHHALFDTSGKRVVSVEGKPPLSADTKVTVWDVQTGRQLVELRGHVGEVFDARFSPDSTRLVTCGRDGTIRIWDGEHFEQLVRLRGHQDYVWSIAWHPEGHSLASGSGDMTVRIWGSVKPANTTGINAGE